MLDLLKQKGFVANLVKIPKRLSMTTQNGISMRVMTQVSDMTKSTTAHTRSRIINSLPNRTQRLLKFSSHLVLVNFENSMHI